MSAPPCVDELERQQIPDYRRLSERLVTAGQPSEDQLRAVARSGFEVVINLGRHDADYALAEEAALVGSLGLTYIHIPVDWEHPTPEDLQAFFAALSGNRDRRLFIHCARNQRVSIFMALHRILREGWAPDTALAEMRRTATLNETWRAFFEEALARHGGKGR